MSPNVDVQWARGLLDEIGPERLADEARALRVAAPELSTLEALDRALRRALARRRTAVSRETFVYLQWRAEQTWLTAQAGRVAAEAARPARQPTRDGRRAAPRPGTRLVCDPAGRRWEVREAAPNDLFGAGSPRWLIFRAAGDERRTAAYLPDWASLPDAALVALLPAG
jgi:hypothetical protein